MTVARPATLQAVSLLALGALACSGTVGEEVAVTVSPGQATVAPLGERTFTANVVGTADLRVTWAVAEGAAGGSVTANGTYTAPAALGRYHVVVTSVADSSKSAVANVTVADPQDLCAGLVQDKLAHPMTAVTKPAPGSSYVDPQFGTTIRRISNGAGRGVNVVKPVYSTIQAWNADESYLVLYHTEGSPSGHFLYDGKTYALIKELDIRPADLEQVYWDSVDPKILYYTDIVTHRLHRFNVDTDTHATSTVLRDFSLAPVSCSTDITGGADPMWTSWDSRYFGYTCGRAAGAKMFTYDKDTNTVGTIFVGNSGGNAPQPAPSGALFFLNVNDTTAQVRDANMNLLRTIDIGPAEHATLGTSDGVDTHFSIQFDIAPFGNVIAVDLTNGQKRTIIGPGTGWPDPVRGTHLSAVAHKNPGWMAMDAVGEANGQTVLDNEIVLINANTGGTICRVGHHRSCGSSGNCGTQGYWAEPHATISPTGTRILFASDWGGGATVDTYVVELPSY
jgi:hypothetical protein